MTAEELAEMIHETYERLAPGYGKPPGRVTARPWPDLPGGERQLLTAVAAEILPVVFHEARQAIRRDMRFEQRRLGKPEARFMVD